MNWLKTNIKFTIGVVAVVALFVLVAMNLDISMRANATAQANAKSISQAVSEANSLSASVSQAQARAVNNTYIVNSEPKDLQWQVDTYLSGWAETECWAVFCLYKRVIGIRPAVIDLYTDKPLPWLQKWIVIGDTLYIGYFKQIDE